MNYRRHILPTLRSRVASSPVVIVEGPRSVGKSHILKEIAGELGAQYFDLDDRATLSAVKSNPELILELSGTVCIDEYQKAPLLLDVIKYELNRGARPGRFILTGSTRHDSLPMQAQALTGRVSQLQVLPLSQGELQGTTESFLSDALGSQETIRSPRRSSTTRGDYVNAVCDGGFPLAQLATSPDERRAWFDNYLRLSLGRDAKELRNLRQQDKLAEVLRSLVGQTGQLVNASKVGELSGLTKVTAESYITLLEQLFLVYRLPAWGTTLSNRAVKAAKIHVVDSGIGARLLRLTPNKLSLNNPTALTEFGHLLESFVVSEVIRQSSWSTLVAGAGHYRTRDGSEVDLVLETNDGGIFGLEVKAGRNVEGSDFSGLRQLKKVAGEHFLGGVILCTGERNYTYDDRLYVAPIDQIWP